MAVVTKNGAPFVPTLANGKKAEIKKPVPPKRRVHPGFPPETYDKILERIQAGDSLVQICKRPGMPTRMTVWRKLRNDDIFASRYKDAMENHVESLVDGVLPLIDGCLAGFKSISASDRLRQVTLHKDYVQWLAEKKLRSVYGNQSDKDGGEVVFKVQHAASATVPERSITASDGDDAA